LSFENPEILFNIFTITEYSKDDGVVKSPISFVAGFSQNLNIPYVLLRA